MKIKNFNAGEKGVLLALMGQMDGKHSRKGTLVCVLEVRARFKEKATADSSLTTPKLKGVWGPVRSE
jgi:hypothetical protein